MDSDSKPISKKAIPFPATPQPTWPAGFPLQQSWLEVLITLVDDSLARTPHSPTNPNKAA